AHRVQQFAVWVDREERGISNFASQFGRRHAAGRRVKLKAVDSFACLSRVRAHVDEILVGRESAGCEREQNRGAEISTELHQEYDNLSALWDSDTLYVHSGGVPAMR